MTLTQIKPAGLSKPVDLADNEKIRLGTGNDLQIYHDGSNSIIRNYNTSTPIYIQPADSETGIKLNANGSTDLFYDNATKANTYANGFQITGNCDINGGALYLEDNQKAHFGYGEDLQIYHNGSDSYIDETGAGDLKIRSASGIQLQNGSEKYIACHPNAAVQLFYDNDEKLATGAIGVYAKSIMPSSHNTYDIGQNMGRWNDIYIADNGKLKIGADNDLQIYHNGSHSYIDETGTGNLYIRNGTDNAIWCGTNDAVYLYYDGNKKFETLSTGAKISGNLQLSPGNDNDAVIYNTDAGGLKYQADDHGHTFQTYSSSWLTRLYINDGGRLATGGETSPDVSVGGLCLNQGSESANILSFKSSDIAHGRTSVDETDTWFSIRKVSDNKGGAYIRGYTDQSGGDPGIHIAGYIDSQAPSYRAIQLTGARKNTGGNTGSSPFTSGNPIVRISNDFDTTVASFTPDGLAFNDDTAAANSLGDYEEGTWSPTMNASGALTVHTAHYIKIGKKVTYQAYITFPSMSGSSSLKIQNFPFDVSGTGDYHSCAINSSANLGVGSGKFQLVGQFNYGAFMVLAKPSNVKATISEMSGCFVLFSLTIITH